MQHTFLGYIVQSSPFQHSFFNDFMRRSLASIGVPSVLEPAGLSRTDGKRPDGVTAIPWQRGKPLVWDVTFEESLAPSRAQQQGSFSTEAETRKTWKYANIEERGYIFQPIAIDVQGKYGTQTETFFNCLTKKILTTPENPAPKLFFINACQWPCNSLTYHAWLGSFETTPRSLWKKYSICLKAPERRN